MYFPSWRKLARQIRKHTVAGRKQQTAPEARKSRWLWLEQLEDRTLLSAFQWTGLGATSNWNDAGNWSPATGFPNAAGDVAQFFGNISNTTVVLSSGITVGEIDFATTANITINSTNNSVLTFGKGAGASAVLALLPGNTGATAVFAPIAVAAGSSFAANIASGTLQLNNSGVPFNNFPSGSSFNVNGGILSVLGPNNTGAANVNVTSGGALLVSGGGTMGNTPTLSVAAGGTITVDDSVAGSNSNRIGDTTALVLNGGTFSYIGANNAASTETLGVVTVNRGSSTFLTTTTGGAGSVAVTGSSLARIAGATVTFQGNSAATGSSNLDTPANRIAFTTAPTTFGNNGGILPYAMVFGASFGDFATYDNVNNSIAAFSGYVNSIASAGPGDIVKEASPEALTANTTIAGLLLVGAGSVGQAGYTLNVTSGGVLNTSTTGGSIGGGTLTFGGGEGIVTTATVSGVTANFFNLSFECAEGAIGTLQAYFTAAPTASRIDPSINYPQGDLLGLEGSGGSGPLYALPAGVQNNNVGVTWTGNLNIVTGGNYTFGIQLYDGCFVFVDGHEVWSGGNNGGVGGPGAISLPVALSSGQHSFELIYSHNYPQAQMNIYYAGPDTSGAYLVMAGAAGPFKPGFTTTTNTFIYSSIAGSGTSLTVGGTGTLNLPTANTYGGTTTLAGGTLSIGNNSSLGSGPLNLVAGTLQASAAVSLANPLTLIDTQTTIGGVNNITFTGNGTLSDTGTGAAALTNALHITNNALTTFSGVLSGSGSLTLPGGSAGSAPYVGILPQNGNLILSGANTYSGGTILAGGSLILAANSIGTSSGPVGTGALTLSSGTLMADASARTLSNLVTLTGNITLSASSSGGTTISNSSLTLSGPVTVATASILTVQGPTTISGNVSGSAQLTVSGLGTLTLGGPNNASFTGGLVLNAGSVGAFGTLVYGNNNALGAGPLTLTDGILTAGSTGLAIANVVTFTDGSYVDFEGVNPVVFANTFSTNSLAGTTNLIVNTAATFNEALAGGGAGGNLNLFSGSGTLTLTGSNSFSGSTIVNGGTLVLSGASGALTATSSITVNPGATLSLVNSTGANNTARLPNGATLALNGGTFSLSSAGVASNVSLGGVVLIGGNSTILTSATGAGSSVMLVGGSLSEAPGATINFQAGAGQTLGSATNQVQISFAPLVGNVIQGATVTDSTSFTGNTSGYNLAVMGANGVAALTSYVPLSASGANTATDNVLVTASTTLTVNDQVNTILLVGSGITVGGGAGKTLTVNGGMVVSNAATGAGSNTISVPTLAFGNVQGIVLTNNGSDTISSIITGAGGLAIGGPGTLTLPNSNTYTNSSGTPEIQNVQVTGTPTGGSFTLTFNGATTGAISYTASAGTVQTALQALSTIQQGNVLVQQPGNIGPYQVTFTGALAGADQPQMTLASNTLVGGTSPTVVISTTSTGSSTTYLDSGTLNLGTNGAIQGGLSITAGTIQSTAAVSLVSSIVLGTPSTAIPGVLPGSSAVTLGGNSPLIIAGSVILNGLTAQISVPAGAQPLITGVIGSGLSSGASTALVKQGAGTLTLTGVNSYGGVTLIQQGAVNIQNNSALGATGDAVQTLTLNNVTGGTFTLSFGSATTGPITFATAATQMALNIQTALDLLSTVGLNNSMVAVTTTTVSGATVNVATVTFQNQLGASNVPLLAANSANLAGNPVIVAQTTAGSTSGTVVYPGAALQLQGGLTNVSEPLAVGGTGLGGLGAVVNVLGSNTLANGIALTSNTTLGGSVGTLTLGGNITGAADLTKAGSGTWLINGTTVIGQVLNVNSTYTGETNINAGVVQLNSTNGLGSNAGGTVVANGATLSFGRGGNSGTSTLSTTSTLPAHVGLVAGEALTISGAGLGLGSSGGPVAPNGALQANSISPTTWTGTITLAGDATIANFTNTANYSPGAAFTISGLINGTGNLTKVGLGVVAIAGPATYVGTTNVQVGVLDLLGSGTLQPAAAAGVNAVETINFGGTVSGGTFALGFNGATTAAITWSSAAATLASNIQTALNALPTIGAGNAVVAGTGPFTVTFQNQLGNTNLPQLTAASSLLGTNPTVSTADTKVITFGGTVTGGTFSLTFNGFTSAAISYSSTASALASNIQAALTALPSVGAGNAIVAGSGPFTVTFQNQLGISTMPAMTSNSSLLGSNPTVAVTNLATNGQAGLSLGVGATLTLDNTLANLPDRLADSMTIALNGGTISYLGNNTAGVTSSETVGIITLGRGANTISTSSGTGSNDAVIFTSAGLVRAVGATLGFTPLVTALGTPSNEVFFNNAPSLTNGILPYATVQQPGATAFDFATYGAGGVASFTTYVTSLSNAKPTDNVRLTAGSTLSGNITVNSLILVGNVTLAGGAGGSNFTLTVSSGAVQTGGGGTSSISSGTLSFGAAEGILFASNTAVLGCAITGSGGLTMSGAGAINLNGTGVYTGTTTYNGAGINTGNLGIGNVSGIGNTSLTLTGGIFGSTYGGNYSVFNNPIMLNNSIAGFGLSITTRTTFAGPITLIGNNSISAPIATTYIAGSIGGTGSLTINPGGTTGLALEGNNTYSGGTNLNDTSTEVLVTNSNAFGVGPVNWLGGQINQARGAGGPTVEAGGAVVSIPNAINLVNSNVTVAGPFATIGGVGSITLSGPISVIGSDTINIGTYQNLTITNVISGQGALSLAPVAFATVTLSGANTLTGGVSLVGAATTSTTAGSLIVGNSAAFGPAPFTQTIGTVQDDGVHAITITNQVIIDSTAVSSTRTISATNASSPLTFSGLVTSGPGQAANVFGGFTKTGVGNAVFTSPMVLTNSLTVAQGSLTLSGGGSLVASALNINPSSSIVLDNTGTYNANRIGDAMPITLAGGKLDFRGSNAAGSLATETVGSITLNPGNSTISSTSGTGAGATSILTVSNLTRNAGALLNFAGVGSILGSATNQIIVTGAISPTPASVTNGYILPFATVTGPAANASDFASVPASAPFGIAPFTGYTTAGLGAAGPNDVVKVTASDPLAGGATAAAVLISGDGISVGSGGGTLTLADGALLATGATNLGDTISASQTPTGEALFFTNTGSSLNLSGTVTGTAGVTIGGNGTLTLGGANTPGGTPPSGSTVAVNTTTLTGGTLVLNNNAAVGATGNLVITAGSIQAGASGGSTGITIADTVALNTGPTGATFSGGNPLTLGGVISGAGGITLSTSSSLTYTSTAANTYTGATTINAGTLFLSKTAGAALAGNVFINSGTIQETTAVNQMNSQAVTISGGGTLALGANPATINALTFVNGGAITMTTGALTFSTNNGSIQTLSTNGLPSMALISGGTVNLPFTTTIINTASSGVTVLPSQTISFAGVTGGNFVLSFNNVTTGPIAYSTSTSTLGSNIQTALNALSTIGGTVSVTVSGAVATVTFNSLPVGTVVPLVVSTTLPVNGVQTITFPGTPSTGTFTLSYGGQTTAPINYTTDPTVLPGNILSALNKLQALGATNAAQIITFTGTPTGGTFTLAFKGQTTGPITYSTTVATLQANILNALNSLSTIQTVGGVSASAVNVAISGSTATAETVTFQNALGGTALNTGDLAAASINLTAASGTPTVAITATGTGTAVGAASTANGVAVSATSATSVNLTFQNTFGGGVVTTAVSGSGASPNAQQQIAFPGVTGGTFTLTFSGQTTTPVVFSSVNSTLQTNISNALAALSNVGSGNVAVSVTGTPAVATVTFQGTLAGLAEPTITSTAIPAVNTVEAVTLPGGTTGGTFTLTFGSSTTPPISYSTNLTTLTSNTQNALAALASLGATNQVSVLTFTGAPTGGTFTLGFNGQTTAAINYSTVASTLQSNILSALNLLSTIIAGSSTTNVAVSAASATSVAVTFQNALGGAAQTLSFTGSLLPSAATASVSSTTTGAAFSGNVTASAASASTINVTFQGTQAAGVVQSTITGNGTSVPVVNQVQTLAFPAAATGGTFILGLGSATTGTINYAANANTLQSNIQSALNTLSTIGAGNSLVNASNPSLVTITFQGTYAGLNPALMTASGTGINEVKTVTFASTPTGSTFKLIFNGQTTGPITYSQTPGTLQANMQVALDAKFGAGNTLALANSTGTSATVTLEGTLGGAPQGPMTATGTGVTVATTTSGFVGITGGANQVVTPSITTTGSAAGLAGLLGGASQTITAAITTTGFGLTSLTNPATASVRTGGLGGLTGGSSNTITVISATTGSGLLGTNPTLTIAAVNPGSGDLVITSTIAGGTNGITKIGPGVLTFAGTLPNTFTGATNVNEGSLWLGKAGVTALAGPLVVGAFSGTQTVKVISNTAQLNGQNIYVNSSGTLDLSTGTTASQTIGSLDIKGGVVLTGSNTLFLGGDVTATAIGSQTATLTGKVDLGSANRNIIVLDSGSTPGFSLSAVVSSASGTFGITKLGAGTLVLNESAANTYTGITNVNEGTLLLNDSGGVAVPAALVVGDFVGGSGTTKVDVLRLSRANQIASTAAVTVNNSGLLDLNGNSNTLASLTMSGGTVTTETGTMTLGGNITGTASLANLTPATISGNVALGTTARVVDVQQGNVLINGVLQPDMVINAVISGSGGLTKTNDPGTLLLTAANIYTGPTAVSFGTLVVDGSIASSSLVTVSGGVLGGLGTSGQTVATTGGTLNPGDPVGSKGIFTTTSAIGTPTTTDFSGGGNLTLQIGAVGAGTSPGTSYDQLNVTGLGILKLGGTSSLTLDLAGLAGDGTALAVIQFSGLEGTFTSVNTINNPLNLVPVLTYQGSELDISFAGPATHFVITRSAGAATAGTPFAITVTALDQFNNPALSYTGTVHFTKTDTNAASALPADYTFTTGDTGVHVFSGVNLVTAGIQTVTATDTASGTVTGNVMVTVNPGSVQHFSVSAPTTVAAGQFLVFTVAAQDQYNNNATSYAGTVQFSSSDSLAGLANSSTLVNGVGFFAAALHTAGTQTITATDAANSIAGTSGNITVTAGTANHFGIIAPASAGPGSVFSITVQAQDQLNNPVPGYAGTVHFTSSDSGASLPSDATLVNGVGNFSVTLKAPGNQTITVTDKAAANITGSATVNVAATTVKTFAFSIPSSATAGHGFVFTVTAKDGSNNTVTGYSGTVHFSSSDGQADLPTDATLTGGSGFFALTLRTAGPQTITATDASSAAITGTSAAMTVNGLAANHFALTANTSEITGVQFQVIVKAQDQFGNTNANYTGTVHLTSSDAAAVLPSNATLINGMGTFNVTLKTPGTQTVSGNDTINTTIVGTSNNLATLGLAVTSFTPTPSGFVATFNKPFDPTQINLYDNSGANGPDDVLLTGPGASQTSFHGSLIIDPSNQTITFVKTSTFTNSVNTFNPQTGVLTAGTYTVTFRSATNGFVDSLGAPLDGTSSGNPAGSNYSTTFVVASTPAEIIGIPGFARGPNGAATINLPNNLAFGIPLNLSTGAGVTAGKFTLQYNSALLSITGVTVNSVLTGATLTYDSASTAGSAVIDFSSPTPLAAGPVRLGGLVGTVPNSAAPLYTQKALLHWSSVSVNGGATAAVGDDSVDINAYFGDANGDGTLSGGDASQISQVATGVNNNPATGTIGGFSAFRLADPVLIGDLTASGTVGAGAVTLMNSFLSGTPRAQIPSLPTGLTIPANGVDPALSIPTNLQATAGGTVVVPVQIDSARPEGSTGVTEAILAVQYNPAEFTVSAQDVQLGKLPLSGSGWQLQTAIYAQTGQIGIDLFSTTPILTTASGTLVTISFHVREDAPAGRAAINLVPSVNPTGSRPFVTTVSDAQGGLVLHTAETALGLMPGAAGAVTVGGEQLTVNGGQRAIGSDKLMMTGGQSAVSSKDASASALSTFHSPLTTALEQVFGEMPPLMMAQESAIGQPGVILGAAVEDGTGLSNSMLQKIGVDQHDWVPEEMAASLGQATKAGRRVLDGDLADSGLSGLDAGDLAGVDEFFAAVAAGRNGRN